MSEVRYIDENGRLVIPKEIRSLLEITKETPLELFINNDEIVIKRYFTTKETVIRQMRECKEFTREKALKIILQAYSD